MGERKTYLEQGKKTYKANLHCHSTLSDGKYTPQELKEHYKGQGYSILSITDHRVLNDHSDLNDEDFLLLTGFEQDFNEDREGSYALKKVSHINLIATRHDLLKKPACDEDPLLDYEKINAYIREAAEQTPVFMINAKVTGDNIYCTYADDFHATYEVTKAFLRRGKEKILFMYDSESFSANQKMAGYEAALQDAGYPIRGELKFKTKNEIEYTRNMLLEYNRMLDFDSVLATEDGIAIGAIKYAKIKGLSIPEELAITGYNNSILAIGCEPELTSVDSKLDVMCKNTVERMVELLENETQIEKNVCVSCEIMRRCTTDF